MHGGIGRSINSIEQIDELQRPLTMEDGGIVLMDLLWSDPTTNDAVEGVQPSPRGPGLVTFGPDRVMEFCRVGCLAAGVWGRYWPGSHAKQSCRGTSQLLLLPPCALSLTSCMCCLAFVQTNDLQMIVRAHECVMDGFERFAQGHLITLFRSARFKHSSHLQQQPQPVLARLVQTEGSF
jgi:hypothetical protein